MTELQQECIEAQKRAGFPAPDERVVKCECGAAGYNTGWGWWAFECGAEIISDGTVCEPCPHEPR